MGLLKNLFEIFLPAEAKTQSRPAQTIQVLPSKAADHFSPFNISVFSLYASFQVFCDCSAVTATSFSEYAGRDCVLASAGKNISNMFSSLMFGGAKLQKEDLEAIKKA
ncbi:MAG: hypothetical protein KJ985_15990, partial [Proteobacteria bacterium]|nr:hypothetical protein [Pseudomonadota bacterium]